jgi:4-amino-4-deoxy-L-arabinose transferase-like glycosyltransferase
MITTALNDQKRLIDYLLTLLKENKRHLSLALITLTAFALRLYVFTLLMDRPGDGPTKAMYAYNWSQSPHFIWHGIWLPGFEYLTGTFSFIVKDPLISIRVLNLAAGVFTVPVFYLLVRRIYGHISGLIVALILAILPVHVSLSVTSHTEATFVFEVLAGLLLLIMGTDEGPHRKLCIVTSVFLICLATMTRYEAWLLIPFFPLYYFLKTRNWLESGFIFIILCLLPLAWSVGNYIHSGDFLLGFNAAKDPTWAKSVNLVHAVKILGRITVEQIEWTLVIIAGWGMIIQLIRSVKKESRNAEKILHIAVTLFFWYVLLKFAMVRGETFQTRTLLFGVVMLLPFIMIPLSSYLGNSIRQFSVAIVFILVAFTLPKIAIHYPLNDLSSKKRSLAIEKLAEWLQHSPYKGQSVLMTKIVGQSTYLPLYYPGIGPHDVGHFIYYQHVGMSNDRLNKYLTMQHPSLLITCKGDQELVSRIEHILERPFDLTRPVHSEGRIDVYDIRYMFQN